MGPPAPLADRERRRRRIWMEALDIAAGGAIVIICFLVIFEPPAVDAALPEFDGPLAWSAAAVALAVGAPIALRRRWPVASLLVILPAAMAADLMALINGASALAAYVLYMVALTRPGRISTPLLAVCLASPAVVLLLTEVFEFHDVPSQYGLVHVFVGIGLFGIAWVLGWGVRRDRVRQAEADTRMARQALVEERLRIARELHDMVARGLSLITVKAAVANHIAQRRPEEALAALPEIEHAAREGLAEVRQLLGMLRPDGPDTSPAPLTAGPRLEDLPRFVERVAADGVGVVVDDRGFPDLPEGLGLTVFRIVQEAITNVVKHAAPAECRVRLGFADDRLLIEVSDDGPGVVPGGCSGGHGLLGMRERVAMYGGTLSAADGGEGGFTVKAIIPYSPASRTEST